MHTRERRFREAMGGNYTLKKALLKGRDFFIKTNRAPRVQGEGKWLKAMKDLLSAIKREVAALGRSEFPYIEEIQAGTGWALGPAAAEGIQTGEATILPDLKNVCPISPPVSLGLYVIAHWVAGVLGSANDVWSDFWSFLAQCKVVQGLGKHLATLSNPFPSQCWRKKYLH